MQNISTRKLAFAGLLIACAVVFSPFSVPIGAARCFPIQHMVNVLAAVFLGPFWGVAMAFISSTLRVTLGSGTLMAFPGSMCGALICGLIFHITKKRLPTYLGEAFGTGFLGAIIAYPVAAFLMGKEAALFTYILPFLISSAGGVILAVFIITALDKTGVTKVLFGDTARNKF